jgi:hypothetical protein
VCNRNVNAAKNILTLLNCLVDGKERPFALRHPAGQQEHAPEVAKPEAAAEGLLEEEAEEQGAAAGQQQQQQQQRAVA